MGIYINKVIDITAFCNHTHITIFDNNDTVAAYTFCSIALTPETAISATYLNHPVALDTGRRAVVTLLAIEQRVTTCNHIQVAAIET